MLKTVCDQQKLLEYACLFILWHYCESKEEQEIVLKKIELDMFIKSLMKDPCQTHEVDLGVININEHAVGCVTA